MVGIVVVAHSLALAEAAVALARQMVQDRPVAVHVAAGLGGDTLGTDATAIASAITAADSDDGVVVLMDLGSAVLSAELALDLVDMQVRDRVLLSAAPLVEGLVLAVVAAAGGAGRIEVAAQAEQSLLGKQSQLAGTSSGPARGAVPASGDDEVSGTFWIRLEHGLHARPAVLLVDAARRHDARTSVRNLTTGAGPVPANSLAQLSTLGARCGHEVQVSATGIQAHQAVDDIVALARRDFDELPWATEDVEPVAMALGNGCLRAVAGSPGIGIGPALRLVTQPAQVDPRPEGDPSYEQERLHAAVRAAGTEIRAVRGQAARELGPTAAAIFDAHLMLLDDPDLHDDTTHRIASGQSAPAAWSAAVTRVSARLRALRDPYLRARAADVDAVGEQVGRELAAPGQAAAGLDAHGVLIAVDLSPGQAAALDRDRVAGIVLAGGSPTAHSTILARSRGIPAVVGAGLQVLDVPTGTVVALDGSSGEVVLKPSPVVVAAFLARAQARDLAQNRALERAAAPACTTDGVQIEVGANLGSASDARAAVLAGADCAGLVRTEFLFLDRVSPPTVAEQVAAYREIALAMPGRRITLRTLDVGGDKPLPYLARPREANPFLGVRGLRLGLEQPALLLDQLRAIVAVASEGPVDLLLPMVSAVSEVLEVRRLLDLASGGTLPGGLRVGIMVEVPATALKAAAFASHVDLFSIGTNDLTQYAMAAERGNGALTSLADPLDPGVLRLIDAVCRGAGEVPVAVCGEMAADESATAVLLGLGVRELSVAPAAVPLVKQAVRGVDCRAAAALAAGLLVLPAAAAVRQALADVAEAARGDG